MSHTNFRSQEIQAQFEFERALADAASPKTAGRIWSPLGDDVTDNQDGPVTSVQADEALQGGMGAVAWIVGAAILLALVCSVAWIISEWLAAGGGLR